MLQNLSPAVTDDLAAPLPVEVSVTVTSATRLASYLIGQGELERRSQNTAVRAATGLLQQPASPLAGILIPAIVVIALLLQRVRPDMIPPIAAWLLTWAPLLLLAALWWAAQPTLRRVLRSRVGKKLHPSLRPGAPGFESRIHLLPGEVAATSNHRRMHILHDFRHTTIETPDAFTMVLDDIVVPIPKRGLDGHTVASLRAVLRNWHLREMPSRPSLVPPLMAAILCLSGFWLLAPASQVVQPGNSLAAAARRSPGQARVMLSDRSMRLDGWRTTIEDENYAVWMLDGEMYDQLRGTIKQRSAQGKFWLGRHAPGNIARTPEAELRNLQENAPGVEAPPDDAAVIVLPDNGVLIVWPDRRGEGACAGLRNYRDRMAAEALPGETTEPRYRRNLLLRFCAPAMSPAELGDWLVAATPAFYAEFNSVVRP